MSDRERGVALVMVMMTITLIAALLGSLTLATLTETTIASHYRDASDAEYTAEAAVEFVLHEIAEVDDWSELLEMPGQSTFVDGPPEGVREEGAVGLDLAQATLGINQVTAPPPGVFDGPAVLYAFGWFKDLVPGVTDHSRLYVAIWLADRSAEPKDEAVPPSVLSVVGEAFGPRGSRRAVEALVQKTETPAIRLLAWRQLL